MQRFLLRLLFFLLGMLWPSLWCHAQELHPHKTPVWSVIPPADPSAKELPKDTLEVLYETGLATYYSAKTHGRLMASGERYDKDGLFCAHKKLPFGTKIRVVNLKNGKEVVVVVKDRGPFAKGRVIDLSNKAAEQLGMLSAGVVPVELWIIDN